VPKVADRSGGRCDAGSAEAHRQCNFSALVPNLPLIIACAVGILCTYAEPAIASLRPLAEIFKRCDTPYLFFVFNDIVCVCVCVQGMQLKDADSIAAAVLKNGDKLLLTIARVSGSKGKAGSV